MSPATWVTPTGPHVCGGAEVLADGRLRVTVNDTLAGRHAIAMIRDDVLDVVLWKGTVRLRVHNEPLPAGLEATLRNRRRPTK